MFDRSILAHTGMICWHVRQGLLALAFLAVPGSAFADELTGDWCNNEDGKLTIQGSRIITPGGMEVEGDYTRHRFEYTAPSGDWNGGGNIVIRQFSDELMELSVDGGPGKKWTPCLVTS